MAAIKFKLDATPLNALEKQLGNVEAFLERKNKIIAEICTEITPLARSLVMASLAKSDLHRKSGDLQKAVEKAVVIPTRKGLRIMMPPGLSEKEYAKQGALQYGATRGVEVKDRKARKALKSAGKGGAIKAHPYFNLDTTGVARLEAAFNERLQAKIGEVAKG